jgi:hypothetical protein
MPVIGTTNEAKLSTRALEDIGARLEEMLAAKTKGWIFKVHRDKEGFISTVEAEPKP